jgi:hypothetical protein
MDMGAINHFINCDVARLAALIWEHWQAAGKVGSIEKPLMWDRASLILSWYKNLTDNASHLGVGESEINRRIQSILGLPFSIKSL